MKRIKILLAIVVSCLMLSCSETDNNQLEENKDFGVQDKQEIVIPEKRVFGLEENKDFGVQDKQEIVIPEKRVFGLKENNGSYELDTSVILSNLNLNPLILELEKENLESKFTYQEAPKIVRNLLDLLTDGFDIANPGEDWQVGCVRIGKMIEKKVNDSIVEITFDDSELPTRELVYLGTSDNITLMTYYKGGIGKSAHTLIIKHDNQEVLDLWKGSAPYDVQNKTEIIDYLKQNQNNEWGLNTNILYL